MMPAYKIEVTGRFEKDFLRLEKFVRKSLVDKIRLLEKNPRTAKALHGSLKGYYSMRHGDYRIIFTIDEKRKIVILEHCGHRKKIYDTK